MASPERPSRRLLSPRAVSTTTSTPAPAATDSAVSLPDDLIFDILSRLPVNSVCRFRCVSRQWCALISDTDFVGAHNSRHAVALVCVASRFHKHTIHYDLQLMDMDGSVMRVTEGIGTGSSELLSTSMDDLVCVTNKVYSHTLVIDPVKGEVLAHCPEKARTVGFGRAVPSGAYKVIRVHIDQACEVFTLGDDTRWRRSQSSPSFVSKMRGASVAMNGVMYLLDSRDLHNDNLLCFDIEREEWKKTIEGPRKAVDKELSKIGDLVCISELNDTLCYVHSDMSNRNRCVNIWLLTDIDNNTWIKAYTIPIPAFTYEYMPLRMTHDDGKLKILRFVFGKGYELCVYDPRTETCTTLHTLDDGICKIGLCSLQLDRFVSSSQARSSSHSF